MAITTTAMTLGPDKGDDEWGVIFYSADLSGGEDIKAAPGTGLYHYIDEIWMRTNAAIDIDIGSGQGTGVTTKLMTTLGGLENGEIGPIKLRGQRLVTAQALSIDASGGGVVNGYAIGHTGPAMTYHKDA